MKLILAATATVLVATASIASADTDWTGTYAGTGSGTDFQGYQVDPDTYELTGSMYGGFAGYRSDSGSLVWGGEIAMTLGTDFYETDFPGFYYENFIDVKAQVGYDLGSALVYVEAGFSTAEFTAAGPTETLSGWNAGIGADMMVTDKLFVGAEFLYRDILNPDFFGVDDGAQAQISTWQIRAGYRF